MPRTAVVLLSGGMDSAVVLAWMQREGFDCIALSIDYGQRHRIELDCARRVAARARVREHIVQSIDLRIVGASALTSDIPVPKRGASRGEIPITYVPARNLLFLSCALGLAEARSARDIAIGVNSLDYSGYPDCRPQFIESFERTANLATRAGVEALKGQSWFKVHAPLGSLSKRGIVELGRTLGVDFDLTISCYDPSPDGLACLECDACRLRALGFSSTP
ncbi:MAG: 7-cyano-7-deazaguanine synthase QueC [Phycisphaerales bacterium]|nr:7-cyano-7-deazaguanine synthase QueC [Phycisphaerales bacterium]